MRRGHVSQREVLWVLAWSLVAMILTSLPYALGWALSSPEVEFSGFVYNAVDCNSYVAKMFLGQRGAWLFHNVYTPEAHPGALIFLYHILLGKVAGLTGLSLVVTYHLARLVTIPLLFLAMYAFAAYFTPWVALRRLTLLLSAFAGGFGWLLMLLGQHHWLGSLPLDLILPEGFTFLVIYALPHLALARTLMLIAFLCTLHAFARGRARWAVLGGLASLGMGLIVPFYVLVFDVVLGNYLVALFIRRRKLPWAEVGLALPTVLIPAPLVTYNTWLFSTQPVYREWAVQNAVRSPHPLHYVAGYALVGVLAIGGVVWVLRRHDERWLFPVAWVIVVPPLLYAPFNLQRRLIEGMQVPLALLASVGLARYVLPAFSRSRLVRLLTRNPRYTLSGLRRLAVTAVVLATVPTNVFLLAGNSLELLAHRESPLFHERAEIEANDWLRVHTAPEDIVFCAFQTGNYVPARAGNRVFLGHTPETINAGEKKRIVARFFSADPDAEWRMAILREYGIAYVLVGPRERALGNFRPDAAPYLRQVYDNGRYAIYRVEMSANGGK
ncbi:MAG: hypothetical protein DRI52_06895 [Chloroflexi bacterium]|nr:MAG: hypothetical protein DRI52_06895 [Chloroflexota bacterium]